MTSEKTKSDPITLEASDWVARAHQGLLSAREQARFQRWCDEDERHRVAVSKAEHAWMLAEALRGDPEFAVAARRPPKRRWHQRLWRSGSLWPAAGGLALATCWGLWLGTDIPLRWQADYYSRVGEVRLIQLPDGSQVHLGSGSALGLHYGADERRVELLKGEAIFTPAPVGAEEPRAFVVEAGGARAKALGTEYLVRLDGQQGLLGVLQHSVELSLREPTGKRVLGEGESAWFGSRGIVPAHLRLEDQVSWRKGMLVFRREPLARVVERLNRYHSGQIVVMSQALRERQVSAVFPLRDLEATMATLERDLEAKSLNLAGLTLLY